jgi:hypothetical protein
MAELSNIELTQMMGLPNKQYTISGDPSVAGLAAAVGAIGYDGAVYWLKYGTANTDWRRITGPLSYRTDEDYYKSRASKLMGSPRLTCWLWEDWLEPLSEKFVSSVGGGGTVGTKYNDCGVITLTANGGASQANLWLGNAFNQNGNLFPSGTGGVWYCAWRGKVANENQNTFQVKLMDTTNSLVWFGDITNNGKKWGIYDQRTTTNNLSAVDNDAGTHVHELVRYNGTTTYYLDESSIVSGDFYCTTPGTLVMQAYQYAGAASALTAHLDWVACAVGGNNTRTIT